MGRITARDLSNLAQHGAGVQQSLDHLPQLELQLEVIRVERKSGPRKEARAYAEAFRWEVVAEIEDRHGLGSPEGREGLKRVIERIARREAGAVLTPWRSMISPLPEEFAEVSRKVEKWGAFLQVTDSDRARARAEQ